MPSITASRSVLAVRDLTASTQFYTDVLGFKRDFGDGSDGWSFLSRGQFQVMLGECPDAAPAGELGDHSWFAYVTVNDIDALNAELLGKGAEVLTPLATKPWGMREFTLRTPDGHRIAFGQPIAPAS